MEIPPTRCDKLHSSLVQLFDQIEIGVLFENNVVGLINAQIPRRCVSTSSDSPKRCAESTDNFVPIGENSIRSVEMANSATIEREREDFGATSTKENDASTRKNGRTNNLQQVFDLSTRFANFLFRLRASHQKRFVELLFAIQLIPKREENHRFLGSIGGRTSTPGFEL